jgi:hypothetical protein
VIWLSAWTRAVVAPAMRRALGLWVGVGIVAAALFGPTGLRPHDVTALALGDIGVGVGLVATWVLLVVPVVRGLVRGDAAAYLRSLPGPRRATVAALVGVALAALQLPWLVLWVVGAGIVGASVVAAVTALIAALAAARLRPRPVGVPTWSRGAALRAVYVRVLRRRAVDAVARGVGLALLAGLVAGLLVRNNGLAGADAAQLGAATIAAMLVPAQVGVLAALADAHRASAWLVASSGASETARVVALGTVVLAVDAAAVAIAAATTFTLVPADDATGIAATCLPLAVAAAIGATRAIAVHADAPALTSRLVVATTLGAAIAVIWLAVLGPIGAAATVASAVVVASALGRGRA